MAKRKRHTDAEVASKLQHAAELASQGHTQSEIAQSLGISVMTFHRWRKAHPDRAGATTSDGYRPTSVGRPHTAASLETENARLRRLVADLLLDKMRLEEELAYKSRPLKRNA
jgi:putative transposase